MGYVTKDIAVITEPKQLTLTALSNFIQFASKARTQSLYSATIKVNAPTGDTSQILIVEPSGAGHSFTGTTDPTLVGGAVYYIAADHTDTAENIRQTLLADAWVAANFTIKIPATWTGTALQNSDTLYITSNGYGAEFNIVLTAPNNTANAAYTITITNATSHNGDSISGEAVTAEISLDVYTDTGVFLGADDKPVSTAALGNYAITLSKTYTGVPVWFDLNALFAQYGGYTVPPLIPGWFKTGTLRTYRFIARVTGINNYAFYLSNALYVLNGYGKASDPIDLTTYTYSNSTIRLLTNKPRTTYIKGQREYLNFIFSDAQHGVAGIDNWSLKIVYRAYSTVGAYIGSTYSDTVTRSNLNIVNTCVLRIDDALTAYPAAGLIKVALMRGNALISNDLEYTIRPAALHKLTQFTFLNRLGGWDSFNFDALPSDAVKVEFDTYTKTITPAHTKSDGIEAVYGAQLDDTITIDGAPVTDAVAEWLKELAASKAVFDSANNYVLKSEFTLTISDGARNMQIPTMKYSLSETYTNE